MATKHYENGIVSASSGGSSDITSDIFVTGDVFWVDSVNGNDANAGTNRSLALATLEQALTNCAANNGDLIILEAGHTESLGSSLVISKDGIRIFGLGTGSSKPSFTVTAFVDLFDIGAAAHRVELNNLRFPVGTTTANVSRLKVQGDGCRIVNCDFYCGEHDPDSIGIDGAAYDLEISGCTFTISADGPDTAISLQSGTPSGVKITGCTFDGGDYDFDDAAVYSSVAHTEFSYKTCTLINKASIVHTAAAKGVCTGVVAGDGSRVEV